MYNFLNDEFNSLTEKLKDIKEKIKENQNKRNIATREYHKTKIIDEKTREELVKERELLKQEERKINIKLKAISELLTNL